MREGDATLLYTRRRARRSVLHTAAFRILAQIATVAGYVVLVRGLSEHDFGVYNLLYAIIPLMSAVASLGLEHVLRRYQPEYLSRNRPAAAHWLFDRISKLRFAASAVFLLIVFLSWPVVMPVFQLEPYRFQFVLFSVLILIYFQVNMLQLSLSSHMLHQHAVGMAAAMGTIKLLGYSGFLLFGGLTLAAAIVTDTLACAVALAGLYVAYQRLAKPAREEDPGIDAGERRRLVRYGAYYNFNDAGTLTLNQRIDNFYIAAFLNPGAVGAYAFYTRLALMAQRVLPIRMFQNVVQPLIFSIRPDQAAERLPGYFTLLLNSSFLLQVPMMAFALAYHAEIVEAVFGGRFAEQSILMPIVFAFATANVVSIPVTIMAQYREKAKIILISKVFGLLNVGALLLLVPILGVFGAALATGASELVKNLFIWWHVRDVARWRNWKSAIVSALAYWGVFVLLCNQLARQLAWPAWADLLLGAVIALFVLAAYARSPALGDDDRGVLASVFKGREARLMRAAGLIA